MTRTIWIMILDNDGGISVELFTSLRARTLRVEGVLGEAWADMGLAANWDDDLEAVQAVLEGKGWETTMILDEQEVTF